MRINVILIIFLILTTPHSMASQPFKVVVGLSKPPYVIKESLSGFELELIQQVLTTIGKKPEFIFIPYGRSEKMLELPDISAVITVNEQMFPHSKALSEIYINLSLIHI